MSDTQILPTPPTAILKSAHEELKVLFARYDSLGRGKNGAKRGIFQELEGKLRVHLEMEELLLYPAIEAMRSPLSIKVILKALKAHRRVKVLVGDLRALASLDAVLDATWDKLKESILPHLREEEAVIFPYARTLPPEVLVDLSNKMRALQDRLGRNGGNPDPAPGAQDPV